MKLKFNTTYTIGFLVILLIEVLIAIYIKGGFIRHTLGDFLVVILLYCFIRSFSTLQPKYVGLLVLVIAFTIEFLQGTSFLEYIGLEKNKIAKVVLGSTFHVSDLVAYTLGIITVLVLEYKRKN